MKGWRSLLQKSQLSLFQGFVIAPIEKDVLASFGNGHSYFHKSSKILQMFPKITVATMCDQNQVTGIKIVGILENTGFLISCKGKVSFKCKRQLKRYILGGVLIR